MDEKTLQRAVMEWVDSVPPWCSDRLDPSGAPGIPDVLVSNGRLCAFLELKVLDPKRHKRVADIYRREQRAWMIEHLTAWDDPSANLFTLARVEIGDTAAYEAWAVNMTMLDRAWTQTYYSIPTCAPWYTASRNLSDVVNEVLEAL
jgi:hypothetical protein